MIDEKKMAKLKAPPEKTLKDLPEEELRRIKAQIESLLPARSSDLAGMDMGQELMQQYRVVLELQQEALNDIETPANQKAQVAGQVKSTLNDLVRMQTEFYTAERFRAIESMLIRYMKTLPIEEAKVFLDEYERLGAADV
jgi:ribosomal protein S13